MTVEWEFDGQAKKEEGFDGQASNRERENSEGSGVHGHFT